MLQLKTSLVNVEHVAPVLQQPRIPRPTASLLCLGWANKQGENSDSSGLTLVMQVQLWCTLCLNEVGTPTRSCNSIKKCDDKMQLAWNTQAATCKFAEKNWALSNQFNLHTYSDIFQHASLLSYLNNSWAGIYTHKLHMTQRLQLRFRLFQWVEQLSAHPATTWYWIYFIHSYYLYLSGHKGSRMMLNYNLSPQWSESDLSSTFSILSFRPLNLLMRHLLY